MLQAGLWSAPAIVIATSAPAAAASQTTAVGSFISIYDVALNSHNNGRAAFNFTYAYQVYNDQSAFAGVGLEAYQAASDPAFSTWATTWLFEVLDASSRVVYSTTGNAVVTHNGAYTLPEVVFDLPGTGIHTGRVTVTSSQVTSYTGYSFALAPVTKTSQPIQVN